MLDGQDELTAFVEWESPNAPTYCHATEPICIVGDAAHATTPWAGAGFGSAIEDVLVLDTVLGRCDSAGDIKTAFEAFDAVTRTRSQQIVGTSHGTGLIVNGFEGLQIKQMQATLANRYDFIWYYDHVGEIAEAAENVERIKRLANAQRRADMRRKMQVVA